MTYRSSLIGDEDDCIYSALTRGYHDALNELQPSDLNNTYYMFGWEMAIFDFLNGRTLLNDIRTDDIPASEGEDDTIPNDEIPLEDREWEGFKP